MFVIKSVGLTNIDGFHLSDWACERNKCVSQILWNFNNLVLDIEKLI